MLTELKAKVTAEDADLKTPLNHAAQNNNSDVVKFFLKNYKELVTLPDKVKSHGELKLVSFGKHGGDLRSMTANICQNKIN